MADRWRDDDDRRPFYADRDYGGRGERGWSSGREDYGPVRGGERSGGYGRYGEQGAGGSYYGGYGGSFEGRDFARGGGYGRDSRRDYGSREWDGDRSYTGRDGRRDWADRAGDEVASWFGDDDAERRRRQDELRDRESRGYGWSGPRPYNRYRDDW